jgi:predicted Rossmann-fold nucleotide-binding protein
LVGTAYWSGLLDWIKASVLEMEKNISPQDLNLFKLVDTADDAVQIIVDFYSKYTLKPNF